MTPATKKLLAEHHDALLDLLELRINEAAREVAS